MCILLGVHYTKTIKLSDIDSKTSDLLIRAISINSGYTSRVLVSFRIFLQNGNFIIYVGRKFYFKFICKFNLLILFLNSIYP